MSSEGRARCADETQSPRTVQIVGRSPAAMRQRSEIEQLARKPRIPIVVLGEPGSGRRHSARALHYATYPDGVLFELDSTSLPELQHYRAHLRRAASQGALGVTLYIPELCAAAASVQLAVAKLLNEPNLGVRLVASSSMPLGRAAREGKLRPELALRFKQAIELRPLRERTEDVPLLARYFADRIGSLVPGGSLSFNHAALELLQSHTWPGNVSELDRLVRFIWSETLLAMNVSA